ncbi:MAG: hypothetical protein D6820_01395 [Lentisphaerae bacterium]|nr:MAG: hypothetical protein D6820_01395 [Lentisphaerota bacterium]
MARIFHAFYPAIGGTWAGDRLMRGCVGVEDAKVGYAVRYVPVSPVLRGHWWIDEQNRLHPDIYMGIDETMTPGRMITFSAGLFPSCHLFYRLDSETGSRLEASLIAQFRVAGENKGEEP